MAVIRVEKNTNYTTMSNYHLRDKTLTLKAIGLLSKILSLPEEWDYTVAGLASICKEGRDAIQTALKELETAGYIERRQTHAEDGSFSSNEYIVHEEPVSAPLTENPSTVNPSTENPLTGNPQQLSKDILSKDLNNPPIAPQGDKPERSKTSRGDWKPDRFEAFWKYYPARQGKKSGKDKARKAWNKLKADDETIAIMGRALSWQKQSDDWIREDGRFIPLASTWLNGKLWTDEQEARAAPPPDPPDGEEELGWL